MNAPHDWQPPMGGQGSMDICRKCGERRKAVVEREPCEGAAVPETKNVTEYDPFN